MVNQCNMQFITSNVRIGHIIGMGGHQLAESTTGLLHLLEKPLEKKKLQLSSWLYHTSHGSLIPPAHSL